MKVLVIASEVAPIAKVGGLADVVGALPKALKSLGVDVSVILPFYKSIKLKRNELKLIKKDIPVLFNERKEKFDLWRTYLPKSKVPLLLIKKDRYFGGKGVYVEADASSGGSEKEAARFLFLSVAGIKISELVKANILHCQDWHTAIAPFLIKKGKLKLKTLLTIHNLAYQGIYPTRIVNKLLGTGFKGKEVNCLKLGILNADFINTVSPNYSKEILKPKYGFGLQKYLKKRRGKLVGILNGIDYDLFNPETDGFLKRKYSWKRLVDKEINKSHLQQICFKKKNPNIPIISIVSRLADQKGIDLIEGIFAKLMKENLQFVLLGTGFPKYEKFFKKKKDKYKNKFWCKIAFNEKLAHQIYAGSDMFLMPSFFEPCGLGQQIAMKYGTVPITRPVGGIKDTVFQVKQGRKIKGNGFLFDKYEKKGLLKAIKTALSYYNKRDVWKNIQLNGMKQDLSWKKSGKRYKSLYKRIIKA